MQSTLTLCRRFLVLAALMFWQGGFIFYSSVVVPIGQDTLPNRSDQGFITQQVTNYMNYSGAVALIPLAWDSAMSGDPNSLRRQMRWLSWVVLLVTLGLLFWLHVWLDQLLDPEQMAVLNRKVFRTGHRWYLWAITIQWAFGIVYVVLMLISWQEEGKKIGNRP